MILETWKKEISKFHDIGIEMKDIVRDHTLDTRTMRYRPAISSLKGPEFSDHHEEVGEVKVNPEDYEIPILTSNR